MISALNNGIEKQEQAIAFNENLFRQQANITEAGEKELTEKLAADFKRLSQ